MMLITTTNTNHIVEAPAGAPIMLCNNGLGQTHAFDRVPALAARCAP
jgi:hypothetical protein